MDNVKFKVGDRVVVKQVHDDNIVGILLGSAGTVEEEHTEPWIRFDDDSLNYTKKGTAVSQFDLELIKNT